MRDSFLLISFYFILSSCSHEDIAQKGKIPHPDSIGVGTYEYKEGAKQAFKDFHNNKLKFYIIGLVRLDSLAISNIKNEFKLKFNLDLNFEGCEGSSPFINGYNNNIKKFVNEKYRINIQDEFQKFLYAEKQE